MSSIARPIIAILGVTGRQGGAVFRALSASKQFHLRGITRNSQSDAAQKLLNASDAAHAELVTADVTNVHSLEKAFAGAWGVFVVTVPPFLDPKMALTEEQQVKTAADAALKAGVKTFVLSSLPDAQAISSGRHAVPHFTQKNRGEQYVRSLPFESAAFPYAGSFLANFLGMMRPKKNEKGGVYEFVNIVRSDVAMPFVDLEEEFGPTVREIFSAPKKYHHQTVFTGTQITYPQLAQAFTKGTGLPAKYVQLPQEAGKRFGAELYDMMQYFNENGYYGGAATTNIVKPTDALDFFRTHASEF